MPASGQYLAKLHSDASVTKQLIALPAFAIYIGNPHFTKVLGREDSADITHYAVVAIQPDNRIVRVRHIRHLFYFHRAAKGDELKRTTG